LEGVEVILPKEMGTESAPVREWTSIGETVDPRAGWMGVPPSVRTISGVKTGTVVELVALTGPNGFIAARLIGRPDWTGTSEKLEGVEAVVAAEVGVANCGNGSTENLVGVEGVEGMIGQSTPRPFISSDFTGVSVSVLVPGMVLLVV